MKVNLTSHLMGSPRGESNLFSKLHPGLFRPKYCLTRLVLAIMLLGSLDGLAQTVVTVTSNPADGATGVSTTAAVVFTFGSAMNPSTFAFFQTPPSSFYLVNSVWSAGNTILTCTPTSPFPGNTTISWTVGGSDATGTGFASATGSFSTGVGGGGGGGSGTNAITTFSVGKLYLDEQTNSAAPVPLGGFGGAYEIVAGTSLASNRTASAVTVTVPGTSTPKSLTQNFVAHEDYNFFDTGTNQTSFEAAYPQGAYAFNVTGTPNNLQASVTLPTTMAQPNAPHVSNFSAIQAVDATKSFTVTWDAFQNGTAADAITLSVSDNHGNTLFATPSPATNGALPGTALSVTIPAGKLTAGATNDVLLIFYRYIVTSNANYATFGYRATGTQLSLITSGGTVVTTTPEVTNLVWKGTSLGFDVATSANQTLVVRYSTDCTTPIAGWKTVFTTNSPGANVHIDLPEQIGATGFFRVQNAQ
jgi:hypothetical protein